MKIEVFSSEEMKKIGRSLGKELPLKPGPFVLSLEGDLGSGKTTFLQGFAKGLGIKETITSPTFLIFKKYEIKKDRSFYHFDAYRINAKDLSFLGFKKIMSNEKNIVAIEWGDKVKKIIPSSAIRMYFSFLSPTKRKLIISDDDGILNKLNT